MGPAFWNLVASHVATYVKQHEPNHIPCKVRLRYRPRDLDLLAFVGREAEIPYCDFYGELEERGYVVVGQGKSEGASHWGVVVEPPIDEDWADCVVYEAASIS